MPMMPPAFLPPRRRMPRAAPPPNRPPSKTTLFVANLPFIVEDENLRDIFSEFNVKEARVMKKIDGKSKGYGFVELSSEDDQRRALQTLDKIEVEGREIIIRQAFSEPFRPIAPPALDAKPVEAPPTGTPAPAPAPVVAAVPAPAPLPVAPVTVAPPPQTAGKS
eukprot:TRINITY_DN905_c0_g1_i5.p2 TRINITY_DN905_c0_g1~~TRINITY_DN905_c0_g1_i5.p2  ORF type:complete len:164 (-),score=46.07 TRINITY_DN905_c0_g1_i5:195-686(-)